MTNIRLAGLADQMYHLKLLGSDFDEMADGSGHEEDCLVILKDGRQFNGLVETNDGVPLFASMCIDTAAPVRVADALSGVKCSGFCEGCQLMTVSGMVHCRSGRLMNETEDGFCVAQLRSN